MQVISDLLKPEAQNLVVREDRRRGVHVEGLSEWVVRNPGEVRGVGGWWPGSADAISDCGRDGEESCMQGTWLHGGAELRKGRIGPKAS